MEPPVFIVGALRSGTTLLRLMLDHHPELCIFGEFEYAVRWIGDDGPPSLHDYHRELRQDRAFRAHGFEIDPSVDYAQLVRSFLDQASESSGKSIPGATVHSNFHQLPRFWPDARYIHLVRDPRDVSRSCIGMGWVGNVFHGAAYWVDPILRWKALEPTLADDKKHQLVFEDLLRDPVSELTRICDFLGITYAPSMLEYPSDTTYSIPDPSLAEQWRRKLSGPEIMWVESVCYPLMGEFGYQRYHKSVRAPSRLKLIELAVQNRSARIRHGVGIYGLPLYAAWRLVRHTPGNPLRERLLQQMQEIQTARLK